MKHLIYYLLISITFFSCNGQEKQKQKGLIDTKINVEKTFLNDDYIFKSTGLDRLFKRTDGLYIQDEGQGTIKKNFYCQLIGLLDSHKKPYKTYALFFDNNDILRDTLNTENKDISLDVLLENDKKGIALGDMDLKNSYFKITNLYEISLETLKLKRINLSTKVLKCEIPIDYLTEEYVGLEDYFDFGINNKINKKSLNDIVFEKNQSSPEGVISSIFYKDKNDDLQINTEILDYISKNTTRENSTYLFALEDYGEKNKYSEYWTSDEISKIKAYIFNTSYPLRKKYWSDKFGEWYNGKPENFLGDGASWRDNDYYGLPKLEEYVRDFIITHHWTQY